MHAGEGMRCIHDVPHDCTAVYKERLPHVLAVLASVALVALVFARHYSARSSLGSLVLVTMYMRAASPVLRTLTRTYADDTIFALTFWLAAAHLLTAARLLTATVDSSGTPLTAWRYSGYRSTLRDQATGILLPDGLVGLLLRGNRQFLQDCPGKK